MRALSLPLCAALLVGGAVLAAPKTPPRAFQAAPGADVEMLAQVDRYQVKADGTLVHERTLRFKVNTFAAINRFAGETRVPWDPTRERVEVLHNRTVLPSGRVIQAPENAVVVDQPHEVNGDPLWGHLRSTVIVHTALEPGAVVETAWRLTGKLGAGLGLAEAISQEFPVTERRIEVELPGGMPFAANGPELKLEEKSNTRLLAFHASNLAALPSEPGAPPRAEMGAFARVGAGAFEAPGAPQQELQRRFEAAGPAPARAVELARKAADAEPDRERKLLAILGALGDAVNVGAIPLSLTDWQLHPLAEVWAAGWASPLEMAALQARVLAVFGFKATPALFLPGASSATRGFAQHERAALLVRENEGDDRLYDPRDPFRSTPLELALGEIHLIPADSAPLRLNTEPWLRGLSVALSVDDKGAVKGDFALETSGAATPHAALVKDPQKLAERIATGILEGAKVKTLRVTRLARGAASLAVTLEGNLPDPKGLSLVSLRWAGVPLGLSEELPPLPAQDRLAPIALPGPGEERFQLTLTLPPGWQPIALPLPRKVSGKPGQVTLESRVENGTLSLVRRFRLDVRRVDPADAASLRTLLAAWSAPDSRELLLRRTAKGDGTN